MSLTNWWHRLVTWLRLRRQVAMPEIELPPAPVEPVLPDPVPVEPVLQEPTPEEREIKHRDTTYLHLRRELARQCDYTLERLEKLSDHRGEWAGDDRRILGNLWGCDFLLIDPDLAERLQGGDKYSGMMNPKGMEGELADAVWPLDFAVAFAFKDGMYEFAHVCTVDPKTLRGRIKLIYPRMIHCSTLLVSEDGRWSVNESYYGLVNNSWVLADDGIKYFNARKGFKQRQHTMISAMTSAAFNYRYEWHAAFGSIPDGPRVVVPTNPEGCIQLFKYREAAAGKKRREKLKHWVEEHYRETSVTGIAYVCSHLRGHTKFHWCGFDCELFPSAFDLEKNDLFKQQAKEWRAQRQHNVVRVKFKKDHRISVR